MTVSFKNGFVAFTCGELRHTDYKPAFVTEGADRTIRYLLAETGTVNGSKIETHHIVSAMEGLRPQFVVMTGAKDQPQRDPLTEVLEGSIRKVVQEHRVNYDEGGVLVPTEGS